MKHPITYLTTIENCLITFFLVLIIAGSGEGRSISNFDAPLMSYCTAIRSSNLDSSSSSVDDTACESGRVEFLISTRYARLFAKDIIHTVGAPFYWEKGNWKTLALSAIAIAGTAVLLDNEIHEFSQRNRSDATDWVADRFNRFGSSYPSFILPTFYVAGLVFKRPTAQMVGLDGIAATTIATVIFIPALKKTFGRYRPYTDKGTFHFDPFSENDSFPSGHSTRAFTTASVVAAHYKQKWVKFTAYGVAGLVAFARVNYDVHFASDVLAGAFLGIAIGQAVVHINCESRTSRR